MSTVHIAITRNAKPGAEREFEARLEEFVRQSMHADGVVGVHILKPPAGSGSREYGVLRSFVDSTAAEAFYASQLFADWLRDAKPLVEGEPIRRRLTGLEAFFRSGHNMPPRWKMAVVTFLGVLPSVVFWSSLLGPLLEDQFWLLRAATINIAVVATLTWGVMPLLTSWFQVWLHPTPTVPLEIPK